MDLLPVQNIILLEKCSESLDGPFNGTLFLSEDYLGIIPPKSIVEERGRVWGWEVIGLNLGLEHFGFQDISKSI